uniref:HNH domain-containing protein n=1 Tax=viral metagenome TaxID=1070528 RepID=A0A6C0ARM7_9ZZZZ
MEDSNNEDTRKNITIKGTNNRYHIKKMLSENKLAKEIKKREISKKWSFNEENYKYDNQIKMIIDISNNNLNYFDDVTKIIVQQINSKIYGYKHQDIIKKYLNEDKLLTFQSVIEKLIECQLKCRYCMKEMLVLYDISRETCQWSVDRIDNNVGHNIDNFHLACLECNLKRRRRSDENFLFTKQLNIIKKEN